MEGYISEGYYVMARKKSWIDHQPPYTREIFKYFIRYANFQDSDTLKRGQILCTYKEIIEALSWYVGYRKMTYKTHQCENAMKQLKKAKMIATMKTTRGMIVSVVNYDLYQTQANYENQHHQPPTKTATKPQSSPMLNKKDKNAKNDNKTYMSIFDIARKLYKGTKRGLDTEFTDFLKHKDWKKVLPLLKPAIERQIAWHKQTRDFTPPWKNFKTWIHQRCWEEIPSDSKPTKEERAATERRKLAAKTTKLRDELTPFLKEKSIEELEELRGTYTWQNKKWLIDEFISRASVPREQI